MRTLAIIGASGHGKVVAETAELCGWDVVFFDDSKPVGALNLSWPVVGNINDLLLSLDDFSGIFVAVGNNDSRAALSSLILEKGAPLITLIHPSSSVSRYACIGHGTIVMSGAVINADAVIGKSCIINTGSSVDHDCHVEDYVHISPGARLAGGVFVGEKSWIGIGAVIRQNIRVGASSAVAAGAAVVRDVECGVVVAGVPAQPLRFN